MLQKRVWCKTRLYFGALVISLLAPLLTGLSVRPFLDQVSGYFTPRMALLTQPISLANKAPNCHHSLRPSKAVEGQKPPVFTGFRLTEPHRPNESFDRPTGRIHAGRNPPQPHTLILRNVQSRLFKPLPLPRTLPTGLRKTAIISHKQKDDTPWN